MAQRVPDFRSNNVQLRETRFLRRTMAEIAVDCRAQRALVHRDDIQKPRQPIAPPREGRIMFPRESGALQLKNAAELVCRWIHVDRSLCGSRQPRRPQHGCGAGDDQRRADEHRQCHRLVEK